MTTTSIHALTRMRRAIPATPYQFVCGDKLLTWESSWYTEPWYTASQQWYDGRAPWVPPPYDVWGTLSACQPPLSATYTPSSTSTTPTTETPTPTPAPSPTASETITSTTLAALVPSLSPSTASSTPQSSPTPTPQPSSASSSVATSSAVSAVLAVSSAVSSATSSGVSYSLRASSASDSPLSTPLPSTSASSLASPVASANNFHVRTWDSQAQGVTFVAVLALTLGAVVWGLWFLLRSRHSIFYAPRSWFVPPSSRPPAPTLLSLLTPWRHLPSLASPTGEGSVAAHVQAAVLSITAIAAVLGLAVFLPITIAGVPHLADTAPPSSLGGRLGSLTDLSILRLLYARDPSTNTNTGGLNTRDMTRRALSSTIAPLGSARGRLIALVLLSGVVWVGASLYIIRRTYNKLYKYSQEFVDACGGQEMVFVPNQELWVGKSDGEIKRSLTELCKSEGESIAGVFSVGHMPNIRALIDERNHVHEVLETAEAKYIESLVPIPETLGISNPAAASSNGLNSVSSHTSHSDTEGLNADFSPDMPRGSAFLEVQQRSSVIRHKGKLMIGQRIIRDEDGTFIPAPDGDRRSSEIKDTRSPTPQGSSDALSPSVAKERPVSSDSGYSLLEQVAHSGNASSSNPQPISQLMGAELVRLRADITWSRARLSKLNAQTDRAQNLALTALTSGSATVDASRVGCIIVGRGVRSLPNAVEIEGRSKEDIMWDNLGKGNGVVVFWVKVFAVMLVAAAVCLPFLGLAVASAPGVSSRLAFLEPLSRRNGLGSGLAEGLVAALGVALALVGGIKLIELFAKQSRPVSFNAMQGLAVKGSFYFLLLVGTIVFTLIGALVFAAPWFHAGVRKARGVGDGAAYLTFLAFIFVINICILVPGLLILQPVRFVRWYFGRFNADTPRKRFRVNHPPTFNPTAAIAPVLAGFFYLSALGGLFPLLVIPVLILAFLSLAAACWLATRVFCITRGGPSNGKLALWTVRRLGWAIVLQPTILGLALLSHREWVAGALGLVFAACGLVISEVVTFGLHRKRPEAQFLENAFAENRNSSQRSLLAMVYTVLPGLTRLPDRNPLPLATDAIDDMRSTERAAYATPYVALNPFETESETPAIYTSAADEYRGLIYPPELLQPAPIIWLPRDSNGYAQREVESLASDGLQAFIDPVNKP